MYSLKILGGGQEVGRNSLEISKDGSESIMLDCGVNFDEKDMPRLPLQVASPVKLKGIVVSHSHLDHTGGLPLYQISTSIPIYGTQITKQISELILSDFLKLSGAMLPFELREVQKTLGNFISLNYKDTVEVGGFTIEITKAGHIPGSTLTIVKTEKGDIAYSGDINTTETKLSGPADLSEVRDAKVFIIEGTYGKFNHPDRRKVEEDFVSKAKEVIEGGGIVLVPAFSLARSQEILSVLAERNFEYDVYYDGMSKDMLRIMLQNKNEINRYDILVKASETFNPVRGWRDRKEVLRQKGLVITGAGMLKGGAAVFYYKKIADDKRNAVFMVGYQAEGTPGRRILETGMFDEQSPPLKARLELFDFSSHAGRDQLVDIIKHSNLVEKVIIVHSSIESGKVLAKTIMEKLNGVNVYFPAEGDEIKLFD
ncbi:MBL fold metallo-hydrolase [Sulfolobales archaeon HS-7]|nr:MBL fold metallo-hydrolase [Sulfolobales archaeon HS-7]